MSALTLSAPGDPPEEHQPRLITCRVDSLRPHDAYIRHIGTLPTPLSGAADSLTGEPPSITRERVILHGYESWRQARQLGRPTLLCLEYGLSELGALEWLLRKHRRSDSLNDYNRIRLAFDLEPLLREQARLNQRLGGQCKGSSNLTEAGRLDVRSKLAAAAGVSTGNLTKVRKLMSDAHPRILEALRAGEVSIHQAWLWVQTPDHQLQKLQLYQSRHHITKTIRTLLKAHRGPVANTELAMQRAAAAIAAMSSEQKNTIIVAEIKIPGAVVLFSRELARILTRQGDLLT